MSDFKRVQVILGAANAVARDKIVNTLHFRQGEASVGFSNQDLADDIFDVYKVNPQLYCGMTSIETRVYDLEDGGGSPVAIGGGAMVSPAAAEGPREVALCLSFRGAQNVPRQRGRIYVGPIKATTVRPPTTTMANVLLLATAFGNIGGADMDWCVFSPTTFATQPIWGGAFFPVQQAWVDDEWDTVRSRGLRSTSRLAEALSE